jgi:hypothetical protein
MTLERRIEKLEQIRSSQEPDNSFTLESFAAKLGFDLPELQAEQQARAARGQQVCLLEIVAERLGISFQDFKASMKEQTRGGLGLILESIGRGK